MKGHRSLLLTSLLTAGVLLAACGSGAGAGKAAKSTTAGQTTPAGAAPHFTKAAYIAQADEICTQVRASLAKLTPATRTVTRLGDTARAFALAAPLFRKVEAIELAALDRLRRLPLPAGDASPVTTYLGQEAAAVGLVGQIADAFARGNRAALTAAERQGATIAATAKGLAQGYGFRVCGNGAAGSGLT